MTQSPKRKLTIEEQIRMLGESGAYLRYLNPSQPDISKIAKAAYESAHGEATPDADLSPMGRNVPKQMFPVVDDEPSIGPLTPSVSPSSPHELTEAPGMGASMGRGNPHPPFAGDNIPPRVPLFQLTSPGQLGGSNIASPNEPEQNRISQNPGVLDQGATSFPKVGPRIQKDTAGYQTSEQAQAPDEPDVSFQIILPKDGRDPYVVPKGSGHANPYPPHGIISPRTPSDEPANDPDYLAKTLAAQKTTPVEMPHLSKEDVISDVNLGSATKGLGVTSGTVQLRDQADNKGQAGAGANQIPVGAGVTGDQSRDNPNPRILQTNVPPSELGSLINKLRPEEKTPK